MKLLAAALSILSVAMAQERPAGLDPTEDEIWRSVRALSEAHHKWPMPPEPPQAPKPVAKPEPPRKLSPEDKKLEEALKRLVPTGRWMWDAKFKLYLPEFERKAQEAANQREVNRLGLRKPNFIRRLRLAPAGSR